MAKPIKVEDIRAFLAGALDDGSIKSRGSKRKRKRSMVAGNVVNVKLPTAYKMAHDDNCQCRATIRVMYTVVAGCAIAASCILGSLYLLREISSEKGNHVRVMAEKGLYSGGDRCDLPAGVRFR